jgi:hypothetical protein
MERLEQALEAVRTFRPMSKVAVEALLAKTKSDAVTGKYEPFKTAVQYDGTAQNPQWMA